MQPYIPSPLPLTGLDSSRLIRQIGPANAALARYDGLLQSVIDDQTMILNPRSSEALRMKELHRARSVTQNSGAVAGKVDVRDFVKAGAA